MFSLSNTPYVNYPRNRWVGRPDWTSRLPEHCRDKPGTAVQLTTQSLKVYILFGKECLHGAQQEPEWLPRVAISRSHHESWSLDEQVCPALATDHQSSTQCRSRESIFLNTPEHDVAHKCQYTSEDIEGAPQVAGMSPLFVSHAQPVPMGGQRPIKKCWQYPHDTAREKVDLRRVTLSSYSYCPTQYSNFCFVGLSARLVSK